MKTVSTNARKPEMLIALALFAGVLLLFFWRSFVPGLVHFSNDGPLGIEKLECFRLPEGFTGTWSDMNALGGSGGAFAPGISALIRWVFGAFGFSKFFVPIVLWLAGVCAWFFLRSLRLVSVAALLGGLAVALNSDFFSTACWGVGSQTAAFGLDFLALGLFMRNDSSTTPLVRWTRIGLSGFAVGLNVVEAADIGALFSLLVAAFVVYEALTHEGSVSAKFFAGCGRVAVIAAFAGLIAYSTVISLISTQVQGIAGTQQDPETKARQYGWATQWSLPKREALEVVVGGLFGFRLDGEDGANYWGRVGSDPRLDPYFANGHQGPAPEGYMRFRGTGEYAGVFVALVAVWAAFQSFRRNSSPFTLQQRKLMWFWSAVAVITLLLAFGRFAPFYNIFYQLPYASTIRNPVKFMHLFTFALLVLFGYGVDGLWRRYVMVNPPGFAGVSATLKNWWTKAGPFDKRWINGCILTLALSLLAWLIYLSSRSSLEQYLQAAGFPQPGLPESIASFSFWQVGWFVLFLALSTGCLLLIFSGAFAGARSRWLGILLSALVLFDLGRADFHWVKYWNYHNKYATNPIIDLLADKPYEHRVAMLPFQSPPVFSELYRIEWAQHHFMFYNIQSLDIMQMPRMPEDLAAFEGAVRYDNSPSTLFRIARRWQLTNNRYFLGASEIDIGPQRQPICEVLNREIDPVGRGFRIVTNFDIQPRAGLLQAAGLEQLTAVPKPNGPYALIEFTRALPRAKLFPVWEVLTNDQKTLELLGSQAFDPAQRVLVANPIPAPSSPTPPERTAARVDYTSYAPKHFVLQATADSPTVLLVNDKFDPNWKVWVDGKPDTLLRCNFIMRGVFLPAGSHTIEFRFLPPVRPLYISLAAIGLGIFLIGILAFADRPSPPVPSPQPAPRQPAESSAR